MLRVEQICSASSDNNPENYREGSAPNSRDFDISTLQSQFEELQTSVLSIPRLAGPDSNFGATSLTIARICFYLLVFSAAITLGATFGAWYWGVLSAQYFVNMIISSLAYFDIPSILLGLVSFGVYALEPKPSSALNTVEADANLLFEKCGLVIDTLRGVNEEDTDESAVTPT